MVQGALKWSCLLAGIKPQWSQRDQVREDPRPQKDVGGGGRSEGSEKRAYQENCGIVFKVEQNTRLIAIHLCSPTCTCNGFCSSTKRCWPSSKNNWLLAELPQRSSSTWREIQGQSGAIACLQASVTLLKSKL